MRRGVLLVLLIVLFFAVSFAQVPREISFQGKLAGVTSPVNLTFKIFDAATGGTELWSEDHFGTVLDGDGLFNVILGQTTPIDTLKFGRDYWIELWVAGAPLGTRYKLTADAYSFRAIYADTVGWGGIKDMPAGFADGVDNEGASLPSGSSGQTIYHNGTDWVATSNLYNNGTNVGIGTTSPSYRLGISTSASGYNGITVKNTNSNGSGEVFISNNDGADFALGLSGSAFSSGAGVAYCLAERNLGTLNAVAYGAYNGSVPIEFLENGSEVARIDASGNVGIGTTSPAASFHVYNNALIRGANGGLFINPDVDNVSLLYSESGGSFTNMRLYWGKTYFNGDVGIGTTSPSYMLDVNGNTRTTALTVESGQSILTLRRNNFPNISVVKFDNSDVGGAEIDFGCWNSDTSSLRMDIGSPYNATRFIFNMVTGKMGIGTTEPTSNLDINGDDGYSQLRLRTSYTPTGTSDPNGNVGDVNWDDNYIYIKTSAGWKRAALSTW